jgi:hypothetical protein
MITAAKMANWPSALMLKPKRSMKTLSDIAGLSILKKNGSPWDNVFCPGLSLRQVGRVER